VVTQVIAAEGDGRWKEYAGGYEDWLRVRKTAASNASAAVAKAPAPKKEAATSAPAAAKPVKLSWKEQRELEALPDLIAKLEAEQVTLQARLNDPAIYRDAPQDAVQINTRLSALESEIEKAMVRWELLEARAAGK
jgi:ATP-binding cassette subfamily F protein uup